MIRKLNRSFKILGKFILYGNVWRNNAIGVNAASAAAPSHINYYMTSVFPDKQTKDEILNSIQQPKVS